MTNLPPPPQLPVGSAVQQVAMQCYCLHFQPQDHSFLLQSNVFTNISKALSSVEDSEASAGGERRAVRDRVSGDGVRGEEGEMCVLCCE